MPAFRIATEATASWLVDHEDAMSRIEANENCLLLICLALPAGIDALDPVAIDGRVEVEGSSWSRNNPPNGGNLNVPIDSRLRVEVQGCGQNGCARVSGRVGSHVHENVMMRVTISALLPLRHPWPARSPPITARRRATAADVPP